MNLPSISQVAAAGRYALTAAGTVVATLATLHLISGSDASKVSDAFAQIGSGIASIATGIGTLVAIGSAIYGAWTASNSSRIAAVAAMPEVHTIVTTSAVAAASPSKKVVSQQGTGASS